MCVSLLSKSPITNLSEEFTLINQISSQAKLGSDFVSFSFEDASKKCVSLMVSTFDRSLHLHYSGSTKPRAPWRFSEMFQETRLSVFFLRQD